MLEGIEKIIHGIIHAIFRLCQGLKTLLLKLLGWCRRFIFKTLVDLYRSCKTLICHVCKQLDETFPMLKIILTSAIIAFGIRFFVVEPYRIPSGSMIPNLLIKDYILVSKTAYGYGPYSFPLARFLTGSRRILQFKSPVRGDIIVFRLPSDTRQIYVKRLVGLPKDTIKVTEGKLYINGQEQTRKYVDNYDDRQADGRVIRSRRYTEQLTAGKLHTMLDTIPNNEFDNTIEFTVPDNHYFFMGDNRDFSQDSRSPLVGFVPRTHLIGKVWLVFFSMDPYKLRQEGWWKSIRSERLLQKVE